MNQTNKVDRKPMLTADINMRKLESSQNLLEFHRRRTFQSNRVRIIAGWWWGALPGNDDDDDVRWILTRFPNLRRNCWWIVSPWRCMRLYFGDWRQFGLISQIKKDSLVFTEYVIEAKLLLWYKYFIRNIRSELERQTGHQTVICASLRLKTLSSRVFVQKSYDRQRGHY